MIDSVLKIFSDNLSKIVARKNSAFILREAELVVFLHV